MLTFKAQVEQDDLRLFFNACLSATSQTEREDHAYAQRVGLDFLHQYICVNYRQIYALMATLDINDHNRQRIVYALLSHPEDRNDTENEYIYQALKRLPVHRVYKLFAQLATCRVNNRRTRRVIRGYIEQRNNLSFDVVKYRKLMRQILRHVHYPMSEDVFTFLYKNAWKKRVYTDPLLENFRQAHFSEKAIYLLPFTIAEGLATQKGVPRARFLKHIAPRLSAHEAWRLQNAFEQSQVKLRRNLRPEKQSLMQLLLYGVSHPTEAVQEKYLETYFEKRFFNRAFFKNLRVATVLDNSFSTVGSRERKHRPLATAMGVDLFLQHMHLKAYYPFWTDPQQVKHALYRRARGATALAHPFIKALQTGADWVVLVSDGSENAPARGVEWVLKHLEKNSDLLPKRPFVLHLNPVWNPREYQPRSLAPGVVTLGIRDIEALPVLMAFGQFFQHRSSAEVLIQQLSQQLSESRVNV